MSTDRPKPARLAKGAALDDTDRSISRRSLLAGSAGLTLGLVTASGAAGQNRPQSAHMAAHASQGPSGSLSQRAYSVPTPAANDIAHDPSIVPPPVGEREPQTIQIDLETVEIEAKLDQRATYRFWTFNGTVPGPLVRVRVGDTVEVRLRNREDSWMMHNIDLHAVTGPGGGAELTNVGPGESAGVRFKALNPGLYVYHCAVPPVAMHIANGMYGMILVEPEEGLPAVDREFYVMQGEIYTAETFGSEGLLTEDYQKLLDARPEYFVLNGHVGALTEHYPMKSRVGEKIRIFFGVGGPNHPSSFHVIGEIFDKVYINGSVSAAPQSDVQTVLVPAGGAAIVEFTPQVPGRYVLVDHSLSRVERGLAGWLDVEGEDNAEIYTPIG